MSRGMPSMLALLGLLAVAGYQNRDKISEMLSGAGGPAPAPPGGGRASDRPGDRQSGFGESGLGGFLENLRGSLGGASAGGMLSGGLGEIIDRFKKAGQGEAADSWVKTGPNRALSPDELERALGADTLDTLSRQTGLSREELLTRLTKTLPEAVDKYTPDGRLPAGEEGLRPA